MGSTSECYFGGPVPGVGVSLLQQWYKRRGCVIPRWVGGQLLVASVSSRCLVFGRVNRFGKRWLETWSAVEEGNRWDARYDEDTGMKVPSAAMGWETSGIVLEAIWTCLMISKETRFRHTDDPVLESDDETDVGFRKKRKTGGRSQGEGGSE